MEFSLSGLSSLKDDDSPLYVQPHYKESYRLAIYALLCGGKEAYEEFLRAEQISHFLSEEEIFFILENAELPVATSTELDGSHVSQDLGLSTYFPTESDEEVPDLDLGWPEVTLDTTETSISLLFHPPRENTPSIKEVVRKQIQEAKEVIAIAMDVFTDVDIFKEIISATLRGVIVYILLDESHARSFFTMSQRVGLSIQDFKNIRVRTVQGQQYHCQSGVKFHGGLEQKFILVDCQTVLYGTYSYTWSFEKINLSMVLVVTGQLVCSYDEEFRRLYARSAVPTALSREKLSVQYPRDIMALHSPSSSQFSLHQIHMKSRLMHGLRSIQDDKYNNITRGLSVQDRLHQSHCPDLGNLVRGHSYGADLQKMSSMTRLKMGTKDLGVPIPPERTGTNLRSGGNSVLPNRASQQHLKHRSRYGADQHLIPFNSETSLHKWKIDTYLNGGDAQLDVPGDCASPLMSPYSSHTGLNENQSQMIHSRSRDIKSRLEEMRQKRLSLQEYANLRKSQESLRSMFPTLEKPKTVAFLRGLEIKQSDKDSEPKAQYEDDHNNKDLLKNEAVTREVLSDGHRSTSHYAIQMVQEQKTTPKYEWYEPLSRTTSAAELDKKLSEPSLSYLQPSGLSIQQSRVMESLTELPEEKDSSNTRVNIPNSALMDGHEGLSKDEKAAANENPVKSSLHVGSWGQNGARGGQDPVGKTVKSSGLAAKLDRKQTSGEEQTAPNILNNSAEPEQTVEGHSKFTEKQREEQALQRKNSMRLKVYSMLTPDERKSSKKEDKSPQRKPSLRSKSPSGSTQLLRVDNSQTSGKSSTLQLPTKKGQRSSLSKSYNDVSGQTELEKHKSPFAIKLSPQHSNKRKANAATEQDKGSRSTLDEDGATLSEATREKAYSQFDYFLSSENLSLDRSVRMSPSDNDRNSFMNSFRNDSGTNQGNSVYQTHGGADNRLGRFIQRFGNLISKNK
ncbi:protein FAM83B-like [Thalassophryne amazonica]|uniref:protein FAM83B-like n=1 Tax=Thalassophryne amazonica TaxID=390379 RepID=UPI0014709F9A|nr:protein FAM83B-like [Thalassophryne amazonica]